MSGAQIAQSVAEALRSLGGQVGNGSFAVTLVRPNQNATPWSTTTPTATIETELPAMVQSYPQSMIDGTLIRAEDRRVMIAAGTIAPLVSDRLRIGTITYQIVSVMETAPSGVALYYEVQARK